MKIGMMKFLRRGFTLMEVNLAIFIMATGILAIVSLYSLGYRESRQSVEDVASAGLADQFLAPLVTALSATNMTWKVWSGTDFPDPVDDASQAECDGLLPNGKGWLDYVNFRGDKTYGHYAVPDPRTKSDSVAQKIMSMYNSCPNKEVSLSYKKPSAAGDFYYALVAMRRGAVISLSFRASKRLNALMSQPVYHVDVHFQGLE